MKATESALSAHDPTAAPPTIDLPSRDDVGARTAPLVGARAAGGDGVTVPPSLRPTASFGDARLPARFWAKVRVLDNGCWEWMGARTRHAYGRLMAGSRTDGSRCVVYAHRFAYEILIAPIPQGLECDHLCRNRACVYPGHIEVVTRSVNLRRSPLMKGEGNGMAKLREGQVREIRRLRGTVSQRKLAARFGVDKAQIGRIQRGRRWAHITYSDGSRDARTPPIPLGLSRDGGAWPLCRRLSP